MKAMKRIKLIFITLALLMSANVFSNNLIKTKFLYVVSGTAYPIYFQKSNGKCYVLKQNSVSGKEYLSEIRNKCVSKVVKKRICNETNRDNN